MISQELKQQARQTNLAQYLLARGEPLKKEGPKRYRHLDHDSLVITDNAFYWNSKGLHGNAIDFLMLYYEMGFKTAVSELTSTSTSQNEKRLASVATTVQVSESFSLPPVHRDMRRSFAYLIKTRCIDTSIVQKLAKEKLLLQDKRGNAMFPWYDEKQKIVGAELHGTLTDLRFKGIAENSAYGYGFNIPIGSPTTLYAFESVIDLLSYWTLHKTLTNALLVSMAGVKEEVIDGFLNRSDSLSNVFLGVDDDDAGRNLIEAVQRKINAQSLFPPQHKDWNDYLRSLSSKNLP